jgi:hypothetical protein
LLVSEVAGACGKHREGMSTWHTHIHTHTHPHTHTHTHTHRQTDTLPHLWRVEDGIHGVNVSELHHAAVGELAALVKLAAAVAGLEDVERWDPHAKRDLGASLGQALGDGPAESL